MNQDLPKANLFGSDIYVTSYAKIFPASKPVSDNGPVLMEYEDHNSENLKTVLLSTKKAVTFLLEGTLKNKVCRYCLHITSSLSELDQVLQIASSGVLFKVTIRDLLASFHPIKVVDDPSFPNQICEKCLDKTIASYLFTQQCEQSERALRNCFDDVYEKLNKLDSIDKTKKKGRHKIKPNYNTLYVEHRNVINYAEPLINIRNLDSELNEIGDISNINKFECHKCWQVLPNMQSLINHERSHPKSMWYNCKLCGKSFVKYVHYKKHIQLKHGQVNKKASQNIFRCSRCADSFDNVSEYLQHLEKHKFHNVMQCLIERKMNKLCSVCLEKSSNMKDLEQMVCLHGGYPDLMGDKTLYHILASTLPDKNTYKYQELLIPRTANIVSIIKKNTVKQKQFYLSKPIIVHCGNIDAGDYVYTFSDPISDIDIFPIVSTSAEDVNLNKLQGFKDVNDLDKLQGTQDVNNFEKNQKSEFHNFDKFQGFENANNLDKLLGSEDTCKIHDLNHINQNLSVNNKFTFLNPVLTNIEEDLSRYKSKNNNCKSCSILNKSGCAECLTNNDNSTKSYMQTETCKICWIFSKMDKCENCGKVNCNGKVESEVNNPVLSKNDRTVTEKPKNTSKTWQCNICMTFNKAGSKYCYCCETKDTSNDVNNDFKDIQSFSFQNIAKSTESINFENAQSFSIENNSKSTEKTNFENIQSFSIENISESTESINTKIDVNEIQNAVKIKETVIETEMDVEIIENTNSQNKIEMGSNNIEEPMDFEDLPSDDFTKTIISDDINTMEVPTIQTSLSNNFQFHIGTSNAQRNIRKKPVRRTATIFHK